MLQHKVLEVLVPDQEKSGTEGSEIVATVTLSERLSICKRENNHLKDLVVQLAEIILKNVLCKKDK